LLPSWVHPIRLLASQSLLLSAPALASGILFPSGRCEVWTLSCAAFASKWESLAGNWALTTNFTRRRAAPPPRSQRRGGPPAARRRQVPGWCRRCRRPTPWSGRPLVPGRRRYAPAHRTADRRTHPESPRCDGPRRGPGADRERPSHGTTGPVVGRRGDCGQTQLGVVARRSAERSSQLGALVARSVDRRRLPRPLAHRRSGPPGRDSGSRVLSLRLNVRPI
jgi:hypothetical protein